MIHFWRQYVMSHISSNNAYNMPVRRSKVYFTNIVLYTAYTSVK